MTVKNGEIDFDGITYYSNLPTKRTFEIDNEMNYVEFKNIGFLFLQSIYNSLGISQFLSQVKSNSKIEYDLNGLTKLLVFERILNPQSKKRTFENKDKFLFPIVNSNEIKEVYRCLDVLSENSKKLQNRMNTKIKNSSIGRNTDLTYYDVTNYFFETMYGDDEVYELAENNEIVKDENNNPIIIKQGFRKKGVSKENSKGPIVQMGLFIDNNGIPVSHKLFPGNTQDKTTFKNVLENDMDEMNLGRPIYVWTEEHIKAHFLICFIALTIIRIIQFKILKYEKKSTLNVDGWEQEITAEKIKVALNSFKACSDKNGTCLISTPKKEIEQIIKSINLEMPDLTTINKIIKFKNTINKDCFM